MAWIELPGVKGKLYRPDSKPGEPKKHACKDCYECQMCSDTRCAVCRNQEECCKTKQADCFDHLKPSQ